MLELECKMKSYIQPFERILAIKELEAVAGSSPIPQSTQNGGDNVFHVSTRINPELIANRLTYWERLRPIEGTSVGEITRQARREATISSGRNGSGREQLQTRFPFCEAANLPRQRVLRYGPHGIHEYRGKFFPQLVRSLLNIAGASKQTNVLDPMCGSGTTPVEAILLGCSAIGLDLNPLSVLMSRTKCEVLSSDPEQLITDYASLKSDLLASRPVQTGNLPWFERLPSSDKMYLSRWFAPQVLVDLDLIAMRINKTLNSTSRSTFLISLSNILRRVSWQKIDDLRVRKQVHLDSSEEVVTEFLSELGRSVTAVVAFLCANKDFDLGHAQIVQADACIAEQSLASTVGKIDVIVTSPPYATALPYLDTDRLSLSYLNLLSRPEHRRYDYKMIGNREVTEDHRQRYWQEYEHRKREFPGGILDVIDVIDKLNRDTNVGFRRRNLPVLLARYFMDMRRVLETFRVLLRSGAPAFVVVGNNHTVAGGQRIEIETDKLLAQLGESVGLCLKETVSMEMLVSRDIFRKNTGGTETILFFKNS